MDARQLTHFTQDTTQTGRMRFADAVAQFFDQEDLNDTEQRLASEIILGWIRQAKADLRQALAERLSVQDSIPQEVIVFLANDSSIAVAQPVLRHSPVLNDLDLVYVIASKGEEHWRSIAERAHLSPIVAERLVETDDPGTVLNLIDNQRVVLQKNCVKKLIKVCLRSEELQAPLLRRPEIDADLASDLYICVSRELQKEIIGRFDIDLSVVENSLENLVEELSLEARGSHQVTPAMQALAARFAERDEITTGLMVKTLRRGQISFFVALFAQRTGLRPDTVIGLIQKDGGKPFALACRSLRMMKSEFASIFLLSRGIRTSDKIVDQRELAMALKYYDAISEADIQQAMRGWEKNPELI